MRPSNFVCLASGMCFLLSLAVFGFQPANGYHLLRKVPLGAAPGGGEYFDYITFDAAARRVYLSRGTEVKVLDADTDKVLGDISATGFPVQLIATRKDAPKLVVSGRHELKMTVDRSRLQEILKAAGHPEIVLPESLDGTCRFGAARSSDSVL